MFTAMMDPMTDDRISFDEFMRRKQGDLSVPQESLSEEEWEARWKKMTPYQRRCHRLRQDPTCAPHGDPSTYTNWGCRCDLCTLAHSQARTGRAMLKDFGGDAPGEDDEMPEQVARLKAIVAQGLPLTAKGQKLLDDWDAAHVI